MEKHPLHIKNPDLQKSEEVEKAVEKRERLAEAEGIIEKIPNNPNERIDVYMERLQNIFLNPNTEKRERNLEMMKDKIYEYLLVKKENFPESYFELQKRIARDQGHGDIEITPQMREQMMDTAIEDQKHSLDEWIEYLTSEDAVYPAWFKYYVWTQVTKLSQFDKQRGEFKKRTLPYQTDKEGKYIEDEKGHKIPNSGVTVAPFPDIYREPLAQICDLYKKVEEDNKNLKDPKIRELFSKKFPSLYAELIQKSLAEKIESKEEIRGEWIKYEQNKTGEAEKLFSSLQGKGTGWCTAGKSTAETQIKSGDFYVYYTYDTNNEPTQPRIAIRMNGREKIGEVRGVLEHQALEPQMIPILQEKLKDFGPEADRYNKKVEDMKKMTEIEDKTNKNISLTKDDLLFLYEIDQKIEGFGYQKDPRIQEIRERRNQKSDYAIIFDCKEEEIIIGNPDLIDENTKLFSFEQDNIDYGILPKLRLDMKIYAKLPNEPIEFSKPQSFNYEELSKERSGKQTKILNPDMKNVDLEKAKIFIPDLSKFVGKPVFEVMRHVVKTYGDRYRLPGLEYHDFVIKNPNKFPQLKDGNYYFFPGSIFRGWSGHWSVPCSHWDGVEFYRDGYWLDDGWDSDDRLALLEI